MHSLTAEDIHESGELKQARCHHHAVDLLRDFSRTLLPHLGILHVYFTTALKNCQEKVFIFSYFLHFPSFKTHFFQKNFNNLVNYQTLSIDFLHFFC